MNKILPLLILMLTVIQGLNAQIRLLGAGINTSSDKIDIVKWQVFDSATVTSYPTVLDGYFFSSSAFNAFTGNYYITGIKQNDAVLLSFNSLTNQSEINSFSSVSNMTQIDMSTGKLYNMSSDSADYFSITEYNISTGTDSLIGIIHEPGIPGIITDASCFNSNDGILYYIGVDSLPGLSLYSIEVRNPVFSYSKIKLQPDTGLNNISAVQYDNVNNLIYAMNSKVDPSGNALDNVVVEIDKVTGNVTERGELSGFPYFLGGSSSFDQNSGSYLLVGFDRLFNQKMIVFNTYTNSYQTGFIPGSVSEIVCDNYNFAKAAYANTSLKKNEESTAMMVFPNPAHEYFTVKVNDVTDNSSVFVTATDGKIVLSEQLRKNETLVPAADLSKGIYLITLITDNFRQTKKLVIE